MSTKVSMIKSIVVAVALAAAASSVAQAAAQPLVRSPRTHRRTSSEQWRDNVAMDVGQPAVDTVVIERELFVIDAEQM